MRAVNLGWHQAAVSVAFLSLLMPVRVARAGQRIGPQARLQGTFLQLLSEHGEWTTEKWAELFGYFRELHLSQLVLQWTVHDRLAFYPATNSPRVAHPPLETILERADEAGMQVSVGLVYDPGYWKAIGGPPKEVQAYLREILERSASAATELRPLVEKHRSFQGWYITQEVEETSWGKRGAEDALFSYLRGLSSYLHGLTPGAKVAVSGFSNAGTEPKSLESFWSALLGEAPAIDLVLFQDGIGSDKLDLTSLPVHLGAIRAATKANGRELRTVVEIFRQIGDPATRGGSFRAVPASLERILSQLTVVAPFSVDPLAFSVPEYMSPLGGPTAAELYEAYLAHLNSMRKTSVKK